MVLEFKLNEWPKKGVDGLEILVESFEPQALVFFIKDPKTFSPKCYTSNNPLERHYSPHINFKYLMGNQCTCNLYYLFITINIHHYHLNVTYVQSLTSIIKFKPSFIVLPKHLHCLLRNPINYPSLVLKMLTQNSG